MRKTVSALSLGVLALAVAACSTTRTTRVEPSASTRTTVVAPAGTVVVPATPPAPVVQASPWCEGAYDSATGTNFGSCVTR